MRRSLPLHRAIVAVTAAVSAATMILFSAHKVHSIIYEPIYISAQQPISAGIPLPCSVGLTGGPSDITISSDPAGAVSYSGTVSGSSSTVNATTDPNLAPNTPVTVYLQTDGSTVVNTYTTVADDDQHGG